MVHCCFHIDEHKTLNLLRKSRCWGSLKLLLAVFCEDLAGVNGDLAGVNGDLAGVNGDLAGVNGDLAAVNGNLAGHDGGLAGEDGDLEGAPALPSVPLSPPLADG
jgi:hypothetical protein